MTFRLQRFCRSGLDVFSEIGGCVSLGGGEGVTVWSSSWSSNSTKLLPDAGEKRLMELSPVLVCEGECDKLVILH